MQLVSRCAKGSAQRGRGDHGRGRRLVRRVRPVIGGLRRRRRIFRSSTPRDVRGNVRGLRQDRTGAVPADRGSPGLLQRLLSDASLTPRPRGRVSPRTHSIRDVGPAGGGYRHGSSTNAAISPARYLHPYVAPDRCATIDHRGTRMESHGHHIAARLPSRPRRRPLDRPRSDWSSVGLVILGVVGLGLDALSSHHGGDPLLAPFRWQPVAANIA